MKDIQEQIAQELQITREEVVQVLELFALETHRSFYERRSDPIGELRWNTLRPWRSAIFSGSSEAL
jgi:hypothetical protein